jgi:hypothetical protein
MFNRRRNSLWSKSPPHRTVASVIYYHFKVCSNLPNCKWANNIIDNVMPLFGKRVNSPDSSLGVRPLRKSNPTSQHRSKNSRPKSPTLASRFCCLATMFGCSIYKSSSTCNNSQRLLVSMVSGSVVIRALKSLPNSIMRPRVWTSTKFITKFWNKDSLLCLEPTRASYTT